jgi:ADP-heptose:LPS heptosyltransferase
MPLVAFATLAKVPGVRLFSLQKGEGREQLAEASAASLRVVDLADSLDDLVDTAAAIQSLDLVVTCDSAVGHLAGALAAPVWVALSYAPDWRWMRDRADSPWYPTMRLFRQKSYGAWDDVFADIATELAARVAGG